MKQSFKLGDLFYGGPFPMDRYKRNERNFYVKNEDGTFSRVSNPYKHTDGQNGFFAKELIELRSNPAAVKQMFGDAVDLETVFSAQALDEYAFELKNKFYKEQQRNWGLRVQQGAYPKKISGKY